MPTPLPPSRLRGALVPGTALLGTAVLLGGLLAASRAQGPEPLRVVEAGWSTAGRATGVPPGAVAVGSEVGRTTETAAVRLSGTGSVLRLPVVTGRSLYPEDAVLRACRAATDAWTGRGRGPAVAHREDGCVRGTLSGGVAAFDLSPWADRTDRRGFVLLPALSGDTAPRTFRLVLDPRADTDPHAGGDAGHDVRAR